MQTVKALINELQKREQNKAVNYVIIDHETGSIITASLDGDALAARSVLDSFTELQRSKVRLKEQSLQRARDFVKKMEAKRAGGE